MKPENIIEENQAVSPEPLPLGGASCSACEGTSWVRCRIHGWKPCPECSTKALDVVEHLRQLSAEWLERAVAETACAIIEKDSRDGMNFYQHTARAAVLSDCRKQLMEIILPNDHVDAPAVAAPPDQKGN